MPRRIGLGVAAGGRPASRKKPSPTAALTTPSPTPPQPEDVLQDFGWDADVDHGLLNRRRKSIHIMIRGRATGSCTKDDWLRPYWLGTSLFFTLFAFWLLDSLKDPVFASLVDGNLDYHQPPAKVCSVLTTLVLVCFLEFLANARKQQQADDDEALQRQQQKALDAGGRWNRMDLVDDPRSTKELELEDYHQHKKLDHSHPPGDKVSVDVFAYIGIPYCLLFLLIAGLIQQYAYYKASHETKQVKGFDGWYILGYVLYASIESFGSLAVAAFWSYTNSTLSLDDAERFYGPIVAVAQLGAIGGSTLVATSLWSPPTLFIVASLLLLLQILVMRAYDLRFKPTSLLANEGDDGDASITTWIDENVTMTKPFWSGVYLILRHNYVLLICGVSCLYEVSLTCLDYQMKLLGWQRFEQTEHDKDAMSFSQFMGHYGQVVNLTSLLLSSLVFPFLIRRFGLRITLRLFPTLLLLATIVTYGAIPGNLTVLFFSMSLLKAMTYSIHDPSKEILYLPTSNGVKLRAKFWIDVVGCRISKAIGSGINKYAGSVDRSVRVGTIPSVLTAAALWFTCYLVGIEFDRLLATGEIVGLDETKELEAESYMNLPQTEDEDSVIEFYGPKGDSEADTSLGFHRDPADDPNQVPPEATTTPAPTVTVEMTTL